MTKGQGSNLPEECSAPAELDSCARELEDPESDEVSLAPRRVGASVLDLRHFESLLRYGESR